MPVISQSPALDLGLPADVCQVLCVGSLYNPDVRYSFNIPIEEHKEQFVWDPSGSWLECSRICQGKNSGLAAEPPRDEEHEGIFKGFDVVRKQKMKSNLTDDTRNLKEEKKCPFTSGLAFILHHLHTFSDFPTNSLSHKSASRESRCNPSQSHLASARPLIHLSPSRLRPVQKS